MRANKEPTLATENEKKWEIYMWWNTLTNDKALVVTNKGTLAERASSLAAEYFSHLLPNEKKKVLQSCTAIDNTTNNERPRDSVLVYVLQDKYDDFKEILSKKKIVYKTKSDFIMQSRLGAVMIFGMLGIFIGTMIGLLTANPIGVLIGGGIGFAAGVSIGAAVMNRFSSFMYQRDLQETKRVEALREAKSKDQNYIQNKNIKIKQYSNTTNNNPINKANSVTYNDSYSSTHSVFANENTKDNLNNNSNPPKHRRTRSM